MAENNYEKTISSDGTEEKVIVVSGPGTRRSGVVLAKLEPYLHLLPDLSRVDLKEQQKLYQALFSVGVSAAVSLHKLLHEAPSATKAKTVSEFDKSPCATIDLQETFRHLTKIGALDDAAEAMRKNSEIDESNASNSGEIDRELANLVTDDVAAAALSAFVTATGRRPPTRHVENLMASSQDAVTSTDEEGPTPPNFKDFDTHKTDKTGLSCLTNVDDLDDEDDDEEGEDDELDDIDEDEEEEDDDLEDDSDSLLRFACAAGYADLAKLVVTMRQSTDYRYPSETTPLMEACSAGHVEVVKALLEAGADVNTLSASQNTALIYASAAGQFECVKVLLDTGKCDLDIRNENGRCALMEAASAGRFKIIKVLIEHGATPTSVTDNVDFKVGLESPLTLAAYKGHVQVVEYLLKIIDHNADHSEELHTALMEASMDGHIEVARMLLKAGAPVNLPSDSFECPLTLAACGGHTELVALLIEHGADLEEPNDEGYTPLMEASREGHRDVVELLLDRGANVNAKTDEGIETALTLAAAGGFKNVIELLIERGGDLSIGDRTPLYEAAQEGHAEVVMFIVQHRRQTDNAADVLTDLNNALLAATETGNISVCNILLENGAHVDAYGKDGRTPLMEAAKQGNLLILEFLIHKGADLNKISLNKESTALSLACLNGYAEAVRYLLEHGSNPHQILKDNVTCLLEASRNGHTDCVEIILDYNSPSSDQAQAAKNNKNTDVMNSPKLVSPTSGVAVKRSAPTSVCPTALGSITNTTVTATSTIAPTMPLSQQPVGASLTHAKTTIGNIPKVARPKVKPVSKLKDVATNALNSSAQGNLSSGCCAHHPPQNQAQQNAYAAAAAAMAMPNFPTVQENLQTQPSSIPCGINSTTVNNTMLHKSLSTAPVMGSGNAGMDSTTPNASQLFAAMAAAAASASCNGPDDWLFAQFIQRSLITTKKRESMSEEDLRHFTEMVQQQFRAIFPSGQVDPAAFVSAAGQQALSNICAAAALAEAQHGDYNNFENAISKLKPGENIAKGNKASDTTLSPDESPSPPSISCCEQTAVKAKQRTSSNTSSGSTTIIKSAADSTTGNMPLSVLPKRKSSSTSTKEDKLNAIKNRVTEASTVPNLNILKQSAVAKKQVVETDELIRTKIDALTVEAECLKKMSATSPPSDAFPNSALEKAVTKLNELGSLQEAIDSVTANNEALKAAASAMADAQLNQTSQPLARPRTPRRVPVLNPHLPPPKCAHHGSEKCPQHGSHSAKATIAKSVNAKRSSSQTAATTDIVDLETDNNHDTPLTLACVGGHASAVELLIKRGADVEHRDKKGFSPLILAATGGHTEVCKILLEHGCKVDAQSERTKDTALSLACSGGRKEVVELLLKANANIEHRNVSDYTPLSLAASGGYVDIINMLLNSGAEINSRTGSKLGISPLMLAAMNGHEAATQLLLERGSDINAQIETNRNTALTLACFQGRTEVVKLLLQYNANVEHRAKTGLTPLMEAANGGYVEVGNLLLESGADPNAAPVPTSRDTALTIASDKGHATFVELLIHAGALFNVRNKKGCSALWLACNGGHLETVQTLIKHNADVDIHDNRKVTPLIAAFRKGHVKLVKYMVRHVTQFPGDQECQRFISTLADKDLIAKCNQCMEIIHAAKAKQAEEANKAAQLLLDQLAQEEALAESKKQSKKRQKEKKKAKKLAKKNQDNGDIAIEEEETTEVFLPNDNLPQFTVEEKPVNIKESNSNSEVESEEKNDKKNKKNKEATSMQKLSDKTFVEPEEESRVPLLEVCNQPSAEIDQSAAICSPLFSYPTSQNSLTSAPKLSKNIVRQSRRTRNESGKNTNGNEKVQSRAISTNNNGSKTNTYSVFNEDEWFHASKKRPTSNKSSRTKAPAVSTILQQKPNDQAASNAPDNSNRGRLQVLNVASSSIARVIGRGGSNINAIRESTLAHIEVEKMALRREQTSRTITIKGNPEAVRQAVQMIDLLINEVDTHVSEIIERVQMESNNSSTGPTSRTVSPVATIMQQSATAALTSKESSVSRTQPPLQVSNAIVTTSNLSQSSNTSTSTNSSMKTPNVWQQRAAKLQQQKVVTPEFKSQAFLSKNTEIIKGLQSEIPPLFNNEEHQRKAPGYARPTFFARNPSPPSTALVSEMAKTKKEDDRENIVIPLSSLSEPHILDLSTIEARESPLFRNANPTTNDLFNSERVEEKFTSNITNSLQAISLNAPSTTLEGDMASVKQQSRMDLEDDNLSPSKKKKQEPQQTQAKSLSDIWANTCSDALSSTNSNLPINTSGLFGNGGLVDLSAVWLTGNKKDAPSGISDNLKFDKIDKWSPMFGTYNETQPTINETQTPYEIKSQNTTKHNDWSSSSGQNLETMYGSTNSGNVWNFNHSGAPIWNTTTNEGEQKSPHKNTLAQQQGFNNMGFNQYANINTNEESMLGKEQPGTLQWDAKQSSQYQKPQTQTYFGYNKNRLFQQIASQLGDVEQEKLRQIKNPNFPLQPSSGVYSNAPPYSLSPTLLTQNQSSSSGSAFSGLKESPPRPNPQPQVHQPQSANTAIINSYLSSMQMSYPPDEDRTRQSANPNYVSGQTNAQNRYSCYGYNPGQASHNSQTFTQNQTPTTQQGRQSSMSNNGYNFEPTTRPMSSLAQSANSSVINSYLNSMQAPLNNFDNMLNFNRQNSANTSNFNMGNAMSAEQFQMNMFNSIGSSSGLIQSGQYQRPSSVNSTPMNYGQGSNDTSNNQSQPYYMFRGTH